MIILTRDELMERLKVARVSKRLIRDLRFVPEEIKHTDARDFLAVMSKSGSEGVLLYEVFTLPFELNRRAPNRSGRVEPIICDICATWQRGTNSSIMTIRRSAGRSVSYLVCSDLDCSVRVRDLTLASKLSRSQLREHATPETRIVRLHERLRRILSDQITV